jgi:hypothetical protein
MSHALIKSLLREIKTLAVDQTDAECRACASAHVECVMAAYRCSERVRARCRLCGDDDEHREYPWCEETEEEDEEDEEDGEEERKRGREEDEGGDQAQVHEGGAAVVEGGAVDGDMCARAVRKLAHSLSSSSSSSVPSSPSSPPTVQSSQEQPTLVVVSSPAKIRGKASGARPVRASRAVPARRRKTRRLREVEEDAAAFMRDMLTEDNAVGDDGMDGEDTPDSLGDTGDEQDDTVRRVTRRMRRRRAVE